jgi:hypothetical protein
LHYRWFDATQLTAGRVDFVTFQLAEMDVQSALLEDFAKLFLRIS